MENTFITLQELQAILGFRIGRSKTTNNCIVVVNAATKQQVSNCTIQQNIDLSAPTTVIVNTNTETGEVKYGICNCKSQWEYLGELC